MADNSLREVEWLRRYETGWQDLVDDFYVPALSRAMQYDRKAGFFSSTALAVAATGVARLLSNGGTMRLLVGVKLSAQDVEAIAEGYRLREEVIAEALQRQWYLTADDIARDRLGVLAEMVARELLEIRVVAPLDERGQPLRGAVGEGMFHEKSGIFTDAEGNQVVFVGSINESEAAWRHNIESFHVYCSWRDDAEHGEREDENFEAMWEGQHPRALTLEFPEALRQELIELRPDEPPEFDPVEHVARAAEEIQQERERWVFQFLRDAPHLENGAALVEELAAVQPWPHQRLVYQQACQDLPQRWRMLCDEVGLGKTIEAGFALRSMLLRGEVRRVLILVPRNLIKQWQQELREKFNLWAYWYDGEGFVDPLEQKHDAPENAWDADYPIIIASAHLARRRGRIDTLLAAREWDLVLVDEAHHARRRWGPGRDHGRNRMLRLLDALRERTRAMMLMTATPMQIDVRELWELLRLLGMQGRWAENRGDDFSRYFLTLGHPRWSREELAFLLAMVREHFAAGGKADGTLERQMKAAAGGFVLWSQLTSRLQPADPAKVAEALRDAILGPLVRDFFRRHTPVHQFAFRYTRDSLRRYREQGLLSANIPERVVTDYPIPLGPARPLYDRIEEYIAEKYRKAEAEKRRGLGYVMTIYRQRLTSSPWAISQTLSRQRVKLLARLRGEGTDEEFWEELAEEAAELDLADDALEAAEEEGPLDPQALLEEINYIEDFVSELRNLGNDPKLQRLLGDLQDLRGEHPRAAIFTQYTDTMDFLRDTLVGTYGDQVACYSGRGGEMWNAAAEEWTPSTKDDVKEGFFEGRYWILVCTEAASEGLNLQASDLLVNYDMPWNPMRVEQRIGRVDRIGQPSPCVRILNYFYEGSVEAEIYRVLGERLQVFRQAVGPLQPVLGRIERRIKRAAMASPEEKSRALEDEMQGIDDDIEAAQREGINVDELASAEAPTSGGVPTPCRPEDVREAFLSSTAITSRWDLREEESGVWELSLADTGADPASHIRASFRQDMLEARPSFVKHCLAWGDPLFERLLELVPAPRGNRWGPLERVRERNGAVRYSWDMLNDQHAIETVTELRRDLRRINVPPG